MERQDTDGQPEGADQENQRRPGNQIWLLFIVLTAIVMLVYWTGLGSVSPISYSFLLEQMQDENVARLDIGIDKIEGVFKVPPEAPESLTIRARRRHPKTGVPENDFVCSGSSLPLDRTTARRRTKN